MKRILIYGLLGLLVLGAGAAAVVASGIIPVRASDGHWEITQWVLNFSSERSINFHSRDIEPPLLDDEGMVKLGAMTYASHCQWCHGRPGYPMPAVAASMTPAPPRLGRNIEEWEARELFYVVKHGIKFTAMPAWPSLSQSEEIWPVVTFLKRLPNMSAEEYDELIAVGEVENETERRAIHELVVEACAGCHGIDGSNIVDDRVPKLSQQNETYLQESLLAYRESARASGVMRPIAARLSEAEITDLARHYSTQLRVDTKDVDRIVMEASLLEMGERLALEGEARDKVPSCSDCHSVDANQDAERSYPRLAGLSSEYIVRQLELFAVEERGGTEHANIMRKISKTLSEEQRMAVAAYYSTQEFDASVGESD